MARGGKREGAGRKRGSKIAVRLPPVKAEIKQELRELAREYSGQALETLVKICESGENETARVAAANALLDRGYGKPSQHVDLAVSRYESMSESELRANIEAQYHVLRLLYEQWEWWQYRAMNTALEGMAKCHLKHRRKISV